MASADERAVGLAHTKRRDGARMPAQLLWGAQNLHVTRFGPVEASLDNGDNP